ncbi:DDB1- and CUL4-associated factor 11 [Orchesella cincta]|uniref:DDB1-and CUL4-associated factor 11 n=1 Tax=Orchesella cincta TaxID=48709 RepID=A0A1D2N631_ORCCI|nr:DDB1- and CUL4-associated factor 11 [Orchesella cincta]
MEGQSGHIYPFLGRKCEDHHELSFTLTVYTKGPMGSNNSTNQPGTEPGHQEADTSNNSSAVSGVGVANPGVEAPPEENNSRLVPVTPPNPLFRTMAEELNRGEILPSADSSDVSDDDAIEHHVAQNDLISVFQMLIRRLRRDDFTLNSGQIHIMSSEDDSSDETYSCNPSRPPVPRSDYEVDTSIIENNDISLILKQATALDASAGRSLPSLLAQREVGKTGNGMKGGFDKPHRNHVTARFLPNTIRRIANYGFKAFCGTYSKNGDIFLSAAQDRAIRIYDTSNGNFKKFKKIVARDVGWSILDTAFSPDGRYVVYSSWSECIHICNIYGDVERHDSLCLCPDNRRFCIFSLAFSEDGNDILGGANDGFLYVYNRESNQRVLKIEAHEDDVNSVAFADETSNILFSAADDGLCKVWDRRTLRESDPQPVGILAGHIDGITYIDAKGDGRYLLTNSKDQSIKLWDMRRFASDDAISKTKRVVAEQNWDYRWQRVPKRCKKDKMCVPRKQADGDVSVMTYRGHSVLNTLIRCHFSPSYSTGQQYIYTGCAAGRVVIYDVLTGKIVKTLKGHRECVRDVSWHPYRPEIVSSSWDNSIGLWTVEGNHSLDCDGMEEESDNDDLSGSKAPRRSARIAAKRQQEQDRLRQAMDVDESSQA